MLWLFRLSQYFKVVAMVVVIVAMVNIDVAMNALLATNVILSVTMVE